MKKITVGELSSSFRNSTLEGKTEKEIIDFACKNIYGKDAFFWHDSNEQGRGQVCKPISTGGNSCITGSVTFKIEASKKHGNKGNKNAVKNDGLNGNFSGRVSKSDKAIWTAEANKKGMKLNAFINKAVNEYIKTLNKEP